MLSTIFDDHNDAEYVEDLGIKQSYISNIIPKDKINQSILLTISDD